ncbi:MAG: carboxymuconolactone decarboxylase family protein [Actinobacteria bacterium]|jgi:4-carboxymuconolactone decarboxylase|nr:carboxymuconolactone decarboxylase family protein [Ilumatobacteraceae bacterium]MDA0299688.1 carboxymuconolactone decarboxylase family protein [Actinomycetota bacterium]MDA2961020.1 carboxymuconolactone decarboxylase family protein [Actinomycetota bacterium]MDA2994536.1 carboxymuconolactone decarboxylase family protein [Actinomycetota bacterium]
MTADKRVGHLPALVEEDLNDAQTELWNDITKGPRGAAPWMVQNGSLTGPFNAWLQIPQIGRAFAAAGEHLRFTSSLDAVTRELVILTVGAHWRSEFEFWAHAGIARDAGMKESLISAIESGSVDAVRSASDDGGHPVIFSAVQALVEQGVIPPTQLSELTELVGDATAVEIVALAGYYTVVSFTLNTFAVPLPDGEQLRFS